MTPLKILLQTIEKTHFLVRFRTDHLFIGQGLNTPVWAEGLIVF